MRILVRSVLPCTVDHLWAQLQKLGTWLAVSEPLLAVVPVNPPALPERWTQGLRLELSQRSSLLPGDVRHCVEVLEVNDQARRIRTFETGTAVRSWKHEMTVEEGPDRQAVLQDLVEVESGLGTLKVWVLAQIFYRHRHRRWRALLASGAL